MTDEQVIAEALPADDAVQASHHLDLEPVPRAAGAARRFIRSHLAGMPQETEESALLLTSELVSNAVIHARTAIVLGIVLAQGSVVVTVHDLDLVTPLQQPYPEREGGWGLELVGALAHSWGTVRHPEGGKTLWFRLLRGPAHHVEDGAASRTDADRRDR